jgi:hypothetical protein
MKKVIYTVSLFAAFALAGCGGKKGEEFVGKMEGLKKEMCACKDAECAAKVEEKMDKLENEFESKFKSEKDVDKGVMEKLEKLDDEFRECRDKATAGGE